MKNIKNRSESEPPSQAIQLKKKETNSSESLSPRKRKFNRGDPHPIRAGLFFWGITTKKLVSGKKIRREVWLTKYKLRSYRKNLMALIIKWQKENPHQVKLSNQIQKKKNRRKLSRQLREWKNRNRERWNQIKMKWHAKQMVESPKFRLMIAVRSRIRGFLNHRNMRKNKSTARIVGCSQEFLKLHIEKQFKPGMSWRRRHEFHIDHRIPLASAETLKEILALCHYKNLQPLWAEENQYKGDKMPHQILTTQ